MDVVSLFAQRSLLALTEGHFSSASLHVGDRLPTVGSCSWPVFQAVSQRLLGLSGGPAAFLQRAQALQNRPGIQVLAASPMSWHELLRFVVETILPVDFPQLCFSVAEASDSSVRVFVASHETETNGARPPEAVVLLLAGLLSSLRGMTPATRPPLPVVEAAGRGFHLTQSAPTTHFRPRMPAQARLNEVFAELSADAANREREVARGLALAGRVAGRRVTARTPHEACAEVITWLEESTMGAVSVWLHEPGGHIRHARRGEPDLFSVPVPLALRDRPIGFLELTASGVSDFVAATAPRLARHLAPFADGATARAALRRSWTDLESAIAQGAADGRSVKEIAHTLGVSQSKVAGVQTQLFRDLGIQSRRSLVEIWQGSEGADEYEQAAPVSTRRLRRTESGSLAATVRPSAPSVPLALAPVGTAVDATPGRIAQLHRQRLAALQHRRRELAWVREVLCGEGVADLSADETDDVVRFAE
jgi:DNA-binding CsgD family transcriptional regulator